MGIGLLSAQRAHGSWGGKSAPRPVQADAHACGVRHEHECRACGRLMLCCHPECARLKWAICAGQCDSRGLARKAADASALRRPPEAMPEELQPQGPETVSAETRGGAPYEMGAEETIE